LWVDPAVHAAEVARFRSKIVAGPGDGDCSTWIGSIGADGYGRLHHPWGMGFCVRPNRYALALATGSALGADVFALRECDNPVRVKVSGAGALCEHVVAGTQFDNMRRMRGLGAEAVGPRFVGWGVRRGGRVRWRCAWPSRAACGMPMRSPMRCSTPNHGCSETYSGRPSFEGTRSGFVVVAGESEDWGCVWALSSAPRWRLSDVCERDQRELAGVVYFRDHVGHREVGADAVTDAALDSKSPTTLGAEHRPETDD
jgi:hypothetical protein